MRQNQKHGCAGCHINTRLSSVCNTHDSEQVKLGCVKLVANIVAYCDKLKRPDAVATVRLVSITAREGHA